MCVGPGYPEEMQAALATQKGANLGLKCVGMRLAAGLSPDPLRSLSAPPDPSRNWGCLLLKGTEGKGKREERG